MLHNEKDQETRYSYSTLAPVRWAALYKGQGIRVESEKRKKDYSPYANALVRLPYTEDFWRLPRIATTGQKLDFGHATYIGLRR